MVDRHKTSWACLLHIVCIPRPISTHPKNCLLLSCVSGNGHCPRYQWAGGQPGRTLRCPGSWPWAGWAQHWEWHGAHTGGWCSSPATNAATRSHQTHKEMKDMGIFMSQHSHQVTSDSQGNERHGHFYEPTQPPGHIRLTRKSKVRPFLWANTATRSHQTHKEIKGVGIFMSQHSHQVTLDSHRNESRGHF